MSVRIREIGLLLALGCGASPATPPEPANLLGSERSPYLREHATDPVWWQPWGDEALRSAKEQDRLILLTIGYASCRWCHVMQRESYADPAVADRINAQYVAIAVDREERPDVDLAYVDVSVLLTGGAGWPLTIVLTPDLEPVFAASYLPPHDGERGFARGLVTVLDDLAERWRTDPASVQRRGREILNQLQSAALAAPGALPGEEAIAAGAGALVARYDAAHGGFGSGSRFPRPWSLELLQRTGTAPAAVTGTLDAMARRGLRDHLGGGFFRYTTDDAWTKPHFEKMLVDQAAVAERYLDARDRPDSERIVRETLDFVLRELALPDGGFAAALDAESAVAGAPVEGGFYTWTPDELAGIDPSVATAWGITGSGPFEGRSLPIPSDGAPPIPEAWRALRDGRPRPARDDARVAGWNGMMVGALARAGFALGEPRYVAAAVSAADDLLRDQRLPDGTLARTEGGPRGLLDDQELVVDGLLDLAVATGDPRWIREALALQTATDAVFAAPGGGWWRTAPDHHQPFGQERGTEDGPEPAALAMAVRSWIRLDALGIDGGDAKARAGLGAAASVLRDPGTSHASLLVALADLLHPPRELVITWRDGADPGPLLAVARERWRPVLLRYPASAQEAAAAVAPLAEGKLPRDARPTAYVCERGACLAPTTDPAELRRQLQ